MAARGQNRPLGVKTINAQNEQLFSGLSSIADIQPQQFQMSLVLPSPAFGEGRHRGLARLGIAVRFASDLGAGRRRALRHGGSLAIIRSKYEMNRPTNAGSRRANPALVRAAFIGSLRISASNFLRFCECHAGRPAEIHT
jgi:hypothetical protein